MAVQRTVLSIHVFDTLFRNPSKSYAKIVNSNARRTNFSVSQEHNFFYILAKYLGAIICHSRNMGVRKLVILTKSAKKTEILHICDFWAYLHFYRSHISKDIEMLYWLMHIAIIYQYSGSFSASQTFYKFHIVVWKFVRF